MASYTALSVSSFSFPTPPPASVPPQELVFMRKHWVRLMHPPNKRKGIEQSRVWEHGTDYSCSEEEGLHAWRCNYCLEDFLIIIEQEATSNALRHLKRLHSAILEGVLTRKRSRDDMDMDEISTNSLQSKRLIQTVNIDTFRHHLTRWVVESNIPFSAVDDTSFQEMLKSLNGSVAKYLVRSGNTVRDWIEDDYLEAKGQIREVLRDAISKIHISCNLWTSPNGFTMCGIAAHFIGGEGYVQAILLARRRLTGAHGGEEIGSVIIDVVREYGFAENLGVFVGDNAESNDTAWRETLRVLQPDRDSKTSRSRCLGHIINLAAKAFIFGNNVDAFEAVVDAVTDSTPHDSQTMRNAQNEWRKCGALGKLHNIIVFIKSSPQRREAFKRVIVGEDIEDLAVILDNSIRWKSTFLSIQHAIKLKHGINLFCCDYPAELRQDTLNKSEWKQLHDISIGLQPFYEVTLALEEKAHSAYYGAVWKSLPILGALLEKTEQGLREARATRTARDPLVVAYQNAWEKLRKYYELTNDAHGIYAAAILLHPSHRKRYFDHHWTGDEAKWKELMIKNVKTIWEEQYKPLLGPQEQQEEQISHQPSSVIELYLRRAQKPRTDDDEFDTYISALPVEFASHHDCIPWLRSVRNPYPGITQHALDLLSIPAMSTELERVFSQAKLTVTPLRNQLTDATIEMLELMRYWWLNNTIS